LRPTAKPTAPAQRPSVGTPKVPGSAPGHASRELRALGLERGVVSIRRLSGGYMAGTWLVTYADGTRVVGKTLVGAPATIFRAEAEGLAALCATGHMQTPEVLAVTDRLLLLETPAEQDQRPGEEPGGTPDAAGSTAGTSRNSRHNAVGTGVLPDDGEGSRPS